MAKGMGTEEIAREYAAKQGAGTFFDFAFGIAGTINVVGAFGWVKSENREDLDYCCEKVKLLHDARLLRTRTPCRYYHANKNSMFDSLMYVRHAYVPAIRCWGRCQQRLQPECVSSVTAVLSYQGL